LQVFIIITVPIYLAWFLLNVIVLERGTPSVTVVVHNKYVVGSTRQQFYLDLKEVCSVFWMESEAAKVTISERQAGRLGSISFA
jgi:hypothetical protein